jgi:hypothetical protein
MADALGVTNVLKDDNIEVIDRLFWRRVTWPTSPHCPPYKGSDLEELYIPSLNEEALDAYPTWPVEFLPQPISNPDDPRLFEGAPTPYDARIKNLVVNLSDRLLDAEVVEARQKGSRDFSCVLQDDEEQSLQNFIRYNDVLTWYQELRNASDPSAPPQLIYMGSYLVDGIPESSTEYPGVINIQGRDAVKLLMLDYSTGKFDIDRINESRAGRVRLSLIPELCNQEVIVYGHTQDAYGNPIAPTYNWSQSPLPKLYYASDNGAEQQKISSKDGEWQLQLGDGQVWFGREWFDDNIRWKNGKTANDEDVVADPTKDPLYHSEPKKEIFIDYQRNVLPEDSLQVTVAALNDLEGWIVVEEALPADITRYEGGCRVCFKGPKSNGVKLTLVRADAANKKLYLAAQHYTGEPPVLQGLADYGVQAGDKAYVGEVNRPETIIEQLLLQAGFQKNDAAKPFYIEPVEVVQSNYLWDCAAAGGANITPEINAQESYPQDFGLDTTAHVVNIDPDGVPDSGDERSVNYYTQVNLASSRRVIGVFLDIRDGNGSFRPKWEVYNALTGSWVAIPDINKDNPAWGNYYLENTTENYTRPGYIIFNPAWIKNNQQHFNTNAPHDPKTPGPQDATPDKIGLAGPKYPDGSLYKFLLRVSLYSGAGTGPRFCLLRPCAPIQVQPFNIKLTDELKPWDILEKYVRPYLPPNYDWHDPLDREKLFSVKCRLIRQSSQASYNLNKLEALSRELDDSELYTEVVARGRNRDIINLISASSGLGTIAWLPYRGQRGFYNSVTHNYDCYDYYGVDQSKDGFLNIGKKFNVDTYMVRSNPDGSPMAVNNYPQLNAFYDFANNNPTRVGRASANQPPQSFELIDASTSPWLGVAEYDKSKHPDLLKRYSAFHRTAEYDIKYIQDNTRNTYIGDDHEYQFKAGSDVRDKFKYAESNPAFENSWVLAFKFKTSYDIGSIYISGPPQEYLSGRKGAPVSGMPRGNLGRNKNKNLYVTTAHYEVWKSEGLDTEGDYELMIPEFSLNIGEKKVFKEEDFVSGNNKAKYLRIKCIQSMKFKRDVIGGDLGSHQRALACWAIATFRVYGSGEIQEKAILGLDKLLPNYTQKDLDRDAIWRRRLRPRTYILPAVNEYLNTPEQVKAEAIAWLRELYKKFLTLTLRGCRPDLYVGDTVSLEHPLTDEESLWAGILSADAAFKDQTRQEFLSHTKDLLVEEVTRSKGGSATAKVIAYRGR